MDTEQIRSAVQAEIEDLHALFVAWFRGSLAKDTALRDRIPPDFTWIGPGGDRLAGQDLRDRLAGWRGSRAVDIWIREVQVVTATPDLVVATYEEWQREAERETCRISTALFRRTGDEERPLRWIHVHETWRGPTRA